MEPLTAFPSTFTAGDDLVVERSVALVPPAGTVKWTLVDAAGQTQEITGESLGGEQYRFTLSLTSSRGLRAGPAQWVLTIHGDTTRRSVQRGDCTILADGAQASDSLKKRAHIDRVIAACEARLEGKITDDVQMYQLPDGVTVSRLTLAEVRELLSEYRRKRKQLRSGARIQVLEARYGRR